MAKLIVDEIQKADYLWREIERACAKDLSQGTPLEEVEHDRKRMWEKLHMQFGDLERFKRNLLPRMPDPGAELKREVERKKIEMQWEMEKRQLELTQKAAAEVAAKKARAEHMQSAAMVCSITDGLNLWAARWGEGWVSLHDVTSASAERDAFDWFVFQNRAQRVHKMEQDNDYVRIVT